MYSRKDENELKVQNNSILLQYFTKPNLDDIPDDYPTVEPSTPVGEVKRVSSASASEGSSPPMSRRQSRISRISKMSRRSSRMSMIAKHESVEPKLDNSTMNCILSFFYSYIVNNEFDVTTLLTAHNLKQLQDEFKQKSGADGIDELEFVIIMLDCFKRHIPAGCRVYYINYIK